MSLTLLGAGTLATIIGLSGLARLRKYLTEIRFVSVKKVHVLQHSYGNNLIASLGRVSIALDKKAAHHVQITI